MEALNQSLFLMLNGGADASQFAISAAIFLAEWPVVIAIFIASLAIFLQRKNEKHLLVRFLLTVLVAMVATYTIRESWYHPRPFVIGLGQTFVTHDPTPSFPSFHATFIFSVGFSLIFKDGNRLAALLIISLGVMTAWARVYLGVHFPFDMAGAFITAICAVFIARIIPIDRISKRLREAVTYIR